MYYMQDTFFFLRISEHKFRVVLYENCGIYLFQKQENLDCKRKNERQLFSKCLFPNLLPINNLH